jgi:hypothetical protein
MNMLDRAADFIWRNARLLERAVFACQFLGGPAEHVRAVVAAHQNADGGFGHALEADMRCPDSQPLHVEVALRALHMAGVRDREMADGACMFLASVARDDGAVPIALPTMLEYPRAAHWARLDPDDDPINPTAALVGLLRWQGAQHPWLERADAWCWRRLQQPIAEAHAIRAALTFLQLSPDRAHATELAEQVAGQAFDARWFKAEPGPGSYGITPVQIAPAPDALGRSAFPDALIAAHLDDLVADQQEDGGWPIAWQPPGPGAAMEWRGAMTLEALTILRAYGRI